MLGPCRRERIAFLAKLGDARRGCTKEGIGHNKIIHFYFLDEGVKLEEARACLDCTGARGSCFLRSFGTGCKSARLASGRRAKSVQGDKPYD